MDKKIIYGIIVKIISDTQIIINKGEYDGVKEGMKFIIYDESEELKDPLTGSSLGRMEFRKGNLFVKQTMPKISILETGEKLIKQQSALAEALITMDLLNSVQRVKEHLELETNTSPLLNFLGLGKRTVKVGDKVRSLLEI